LFIPEEHNDFDEKHCQTRVMMDGLLMEHFENDIH
jgi:hypothetical protein